MKIEKYLTETAKALLKAKDGKKPRFCIVDEDHIFVTNDGFMGIVIPKYYNIFNEEISQYKLVDDSGEDVKRTGVLIESEFYGFIHETDNGLGIQDKFLKYFDKYATLKCKGDMFKVFENDVLVGIIMGVKLKK